MRNPTLFLDRDGTINVNIDDGYVTRPEELKLLPGAAAALMRARKGGFKLVVITNQAGVAKGLYSEKTLGEIHEHMTALIRKETGDSKFTFDRIEFCPHKPADACACRKPKTLMVERATAALSCDLTKSFFIGDKDADLQCGASAGIRSILVRTGQGDRAQTKPTFVAKDLNEAVDLALKNL